MRVPKRSPFFLFFLRNVMSLPCFNCCGVFVLSLFVFPSVLWVCGLLLLSSPGSCEETSSCGDHSILTGRRRTRFVFLSFYICVFHQFLFSYFTPPLTYYLWSGKAVCGHIVEVGCGEREAGQGRKHTYPHGVPFVLIYSREPYFW